MSGQTQQDDVAARAATLDEWIAALMEQQAARQPMLHDPETAKRLPPKPDER